MKRSKNEQVQQFLEDIMMSDGDKFNILKELREIVFKLSPEVNEKIMYSGIMFSLDDDFGSVFVGKNHASFEFGSGYQFDDPKKLLDGTGKFRRHLKIKSLTDIKGKEVDFFVTQAV